MERSITELQNLYCDILNKFKYVYICIHVFQKKHPQGGRVRQVYSPHLPSKKAGLITPSDYSNYSGHFTGKRGFCLLLFTLGAFVFVVSQVERLSSDVYYPSALPLWSTVSSAFLSVLNDSFINQDITQGPQIQTGIDLAKLSRMN